MSRRSLHLVLLAILLAIAPGLATAGKISIANNGAPLGDATLSVETFGGEQLVTTQTNAGGVADCVIPQAGAGQPLVFKVTDKAGNVSEHFLAQPADKPWHLVAMDTQGGIVGYSEETYGHIKAAMEPLYVGKNSEVGSGASLKSKIKQKVGGGMFGGGKSTFSLGGGGGGGMSGMRLASPEPKGDRDIKTEDDPISDADKRVFVHPATKMKVGVGTRFFPEGLLVSTQIIEAPGYGTFQSMSLMDENGNMAGPTRIMMFQTYMDWWLYVYWWRTTYVDGQVVSHEEGGWSDEGRILGDKYSQSVGSDGLWNRGGGFGSAFGGMQGMGAVFPVKSVVYDDFGIPVEEGPLGIRMPDAYYRIAKPTLTLIGHITRPDEDPVVTTGFAFGLASPADEAAIREEHVRFRLKDVKIRIEEKEERIKQLQRGLPLKRSAPTLPGTQTKVMDDREWDEKQDKVDREKIKNLETEVEDLKDEQGRLEAELEGRFDPVVEQLQPIVVLA